MNRVWGNLFGVECSVQSRDSVFQCGSVWGGGLYALGPTDAIFKDYRMVELIVMESYFCCSL